MRFNGEKSPDPMRIIRAVLIHTNRSRRNEPGRLSKINDTSSNASHPGTEPSDVGKRLSHELKMGWIHNNGSEKEKAEPQVDFQDLSDPSLLQIGLETSHIPP